MKNIVILIVVFIVSICQADYHGTDDGSQQNPYHISSKADILQLAATPADFESYFILTADIDMFGEVFTNSVIASSVENTNSTSTGKTFGGNFNGNGHKINNIAITTLGTENDYLGLFGRVASTSGTKTMIYNLEVKIEINSGDYARQIGGITGYLGQSATVSNCIASVRIELADDNELVGGICGNNYDGKIVDCRASGFILSGLHCENIGGIVGSNSSGGSVSTCFADVYIECDQDTRLLGGICGYNNQYAVISNCYSVGNITSISNCWAFGGVCGWNTGTISDCGTKCTVTAVSDSYYYAGFVGFIGTGGLVKNSYSATTIINNGASAVGGGFCAGSVTNGTTNCFWNIEVANYNINASGIGTNTATMKQDVIFVDSGWNFDSNSGVWAMSSTGSEFEGYPVQQWLDVKLVSLTISGAASVFENTTSQYQCQADFSDGTEDDVTSSVLWSENSAFASIDVAGMLKTIPVTSGKSITVSAEYVYNGIPTNVVKNVLIINTPYSGGEGTSGNPYILVDETDLSLLAATTSDYDMHFKLGDDISMKNSVMTAYIASDTDSSTAGFQGTPFSGTFDGNKHKISNLACGSSDKDYIAFFGQLSSTAEVKDLFLYDMSSTGRSLVSAICAHNDGGQISQCAATGQVDGWSGVGGLCGLNENKASIENSFSHAKVTSSGTSSSYIGGFCAQNSATISKCYSAGVMSLAYLATDVGGFCGSNSGVGTIDDSFWDTAVSAVFISSGGTGKSSAAMKLLLTFTSAGWSAPYPWQKSDSSGIFDGYMMLAWQSSFYSDEYLDWLTGFFPGGYPGNDVDSDLDGMLNGDEFIALTDPVDSNSFFCISGIQPVANGIELQWVAASNRLYSVRKKASMTNTFLLLDDSIQYPVSNFIDTNAFDNDGNVYQIQVDIAE